MPALTLRRPHFLLGTVIFAAIIAYGSLVPFHFAPLGAGELAERFTTVLTTPVKAISKSDFLANILLFVPLSFFLMGTFRLNRKSCSWLMVLPVTGLCIAYGSCVECLQIMFPPRNASLSDIVAQSIGAFSGGLLWIAMGAKLIDRFNALNAQMNAANRLFGVLTLYLLAIVVLETVPFDFTLSPVEMVHKWREGRIGVVPLAAFLDPERNMIAKSLWHAVLFLPVGLMLGCHRYLSAGRAAFLAMLMAGCVELIQLPVLSRFFEPTDILTGALAIMVGWWIVQHHAVRHVAIGPTLFATWLLFAIAINWSPFDFTINGVEARLQAVSLVPFADYQQKHYLSAFDDLFHKLVLFVLLGLLLASISSRRRSAFLVAGMGGIISAIIECGQLFLPSRYPSVSDMVLGFLGSLAGHSLVHAMPWSDARVIPLES